MREEGKESDAREDEEEVDIVDLVQEEHYAKIHLLNVAGKACVVRARG